MKSVRVATSWVPPSRRDGARQPSKFEIPISWVLHNANLKKDARFKITAAVDALVASNQSFSVRDLQVRANCSITTLYKHQDLWKDAQEQLRARLFASVTHEYIPGDSPVSLETEFSVLTIEEVQSEFDELFVSGEIQRDELAYRRDSKVVHTWIQPILKLLPRSLGQADSSCLLFLTSTLSWFLSNSPTAACDRWLFGRLQLIRFELDQRFLDFRSIGKWKFSDFDKGMCNRYLRFPGKEGVGVVRRLCVERSLSLSRKHPPPG